MATEDYSPYFEENVEHIYSSFSELWKVMQSHGLFYNAINFTEMREVEAINFMTIYLLGATRQYPDREIAWQHAKIILDQLFSKEANY